MDSRTFKCSDPYIPALRQFVQICDEASMLEKQRKSQPWLTLSEKFKLWRQRRSMQKDAKSIFKELDEICVLRLFRQIEDPKVFLDSMILAPDARDKVDFYQWRIREMEEGKIQFISPVEIEERYLLYQNNLTDKYVIVSL